MKTLHWGKIPDAKIKGTMWDKDVKDDGVKVTASSALTPTPTPTPAPIPTLPLPSTLLKVNVSELESLFAAKKPAAPKQTEGGEGGEGGAQHADLALTPTLTITLTLTLTLALALTPIPTLTRRRQEARRDRHPGRPQDLAEHGHRHLPLQDDVRTLPLT